VKNRIFLMLILTGILVLTGSWGGSGHTKISHDASLSFDPQMTIFNLWTLDLAAHASDADYRKDTDPNEAPKHYIDIDSYPEFMMTGYIASTLDSVVNLHGASFVYDNGILPYATRTTYDSLRNCFHRGDWDKALLFAADLGHYVGDGHMPLHITTNYNGQLTNNYGIHSRYESTMINTYVNQITYTGDSVHFITDVNRYIFNYIYHNFNYVDSVLLADTYAKTISSNTSSSQYKQALWNRTKLFTTELFKNASHSLAELIYTAWINAGSPAFGQASVFNQLLPQMPLIGSVSPNPFQQFCTIQYSVPEKSMISLKVTDITGCDVVSLQQGVKPKGNYSICWSPEGVKPGVYYIVLNSGKKGMVKKVILTK
jgi:hypothetical protein